MSFQNGHFYYTSVIDETPVWFSNIFSQKLSKPYRKIYLKFPFLKLCAVVKTFDSNSYTVKPLNRPPGVPIILAGLEGWPVY